MILSIKVFLSRILCSNSIGYVIARIFNDKIPFYGTKIATHHKQIKNRTKAMLFWRMYESSEIRFVQRYLKGNYDVIELGSSIGAVSVQLGRKLKHRKLITIEANPNLIDTLKHNLISNGIDHAVVVHAAYASTQSKVWFEFGAENILGKISSPQEGKQGLFIDTINLETIITSQGIKEYTLVCDIEGAEIDLLLNEQKALENCKLLIIETHRTTFHQRIYTPEQLKIMLLDMGFRLVAQHGVNLVLER